MANKLTHAAVAVQRRADPAAATAPSRSSVQLKKQLAGQDFDVQAKMLEPEGGPKAGAEPAAGALSGRYVVLGAWDSFSEWHLEFKGGELVDSHTDDLSAADWPTQMARNGNEIVLTQTTEASDATMTEQLTLESSSAGGLSAKSATTTFVDHTSDGDVSTRAQSSLTVIPA